MKQKSVQVVCHDEQLSCTQIEKLVNVFSIGLARAWLDMQNLEQTDFNYVITKVKER